MVWHRDISSTDLQKNLETEKKKFEKVKETLAKTEEEFKVLKKVWSFFCWINEFFWFLLSTSQFSLDSGSCDLVLGMTFETPALLNSLRLEKFSI